MTWIDAYRRRLARRRYAAEGERIRERIARILDRRRPTTDDPDMGMRRLSPSTAGDVYAASIESNCVVLELRVKGDRLAKIEAVRINPKTRAWSFDYGKLSAHGAAAVLWPGREANEMLAELDQLLGGGK